MTPAENIPSLLGLVSPWSIFLRPGLVLQRLLATVQAKSPTCRCCKAWGSCRLLPPFQQEWLVWKRRLGSSFSRGGQGQKVGSQGVTCASPCHTCEALCQQLGQRRAHTLLGIQHIPNNFVTLYTGLLLVPLQTRTSSDCRVRSSSQTGKSELGATRPTSGKERISGKPRALQKVYQQRRNKWKNPSQEKNCSDATHSRNQSMLPVSAVLEPSWIHLLFSNREFKMTYENHDDPEGKKSTQRVVRLHILKVF